MKIQTFVSFITLCTLYSCCNPSVVGSGYSMPVATTETHTKTMQPASLSMPYLPPANVYQQAPMTFSQPMQAPVCQPMQYNAPQPMQYAPQVQYQAVPVCPPASMYQSQPYQSNPCAPVQLQSYQDPCAPMQYQAQPVRYNMVGTAQPAQPQYIVVQPNPASNTLPVQLNSTRASQEHCE